MFAYEVMSRRPISTNMLARTGSRRRSEMRAATWLPTEIPGRETSSRGPNNGPIHAADEPVAQAGRKGEGHRMCKVGADDADGRQARIEKEEHGHAQGAGTYRAERHKHAKHRTEHHEDRARV